MATKFPNQIDDFPIKQPSEIIRAKHVNDLQDAAIAIEIFTKNLQRDLIDHITTKHTALTTGVDSNGLGSFVVDGYSLPQQANNVQSALELLKKYSETIKSKLELDLNQHLNSTIAHDASDISVDTIPFTNKLSSLQTTVQRALETLDQHTHLTSELIDQDGYFYLDEKVLNCLNNFTKDSFTIQTDLIDGYIVNDLRYQNSSTTFLSEDNQGLKVDIIQESIQHQLILGHGEKTHIEIDQHIESNSAHGVDGYIVGTNSSQTLTNKKIVSAFIGPKLLLFTNSVEQVEQDYYLNLLESTNKEFEIRHPSLSEVTFHNPGTNTFRVVSPQNFQLGDRTRINNQIYIGEISNINQDLITIDFDFPLAPSLNLTGYYLINIEKEIPILTIDNSLDKLIVKNLKVLNTLEFENLQLSIEHLDAIDGYIRDDLEVGNNLHVKNNLQIDGQLSLGDLRVENGEFDNLTINQIFNQRNNITELTGELSLFGVNNFISNVICILKNSTSVEIDYNFVKQNLIQRGKFRVIKDGYIGFDYDLDYVGNDCFFEFIVEPYGSELGVKLKNLDSNEGIFRYKIRKIE